MLYADLTRGDLADITMITSKAVDTLTELPYAYIGVGVVVQYEEERSEL